MDRKTPPRLMVLLSALALVAASTALAQNAPRRSGEDVGVALAMQGQATSAESVFVSMLSHTRGDARALNNLGNLRLVRGDYGVALAFYDRALRGDSTDAGLHLNRATALMLMGDESRSREAAREAVRLAGGLSAAEALVGIRETKDPTARASERRGTISQDDLRSLLAEAAAAVPSDTTKKVSSTPGAAGTRGRGQSWRSAGPRAADASDASAIVNLLYWKK